MARLRLCRGCAFAAGTAQQLDGMLQYGQDDLEADEIALIESSVDASA